MRFEYVDYQRVGSIATIRLNRPERRNALGRDLVRDLDAAWRAFEDDQTALVAVYTGEGTAFCAGMDVTEANEDRIESSISLEPHPLTVFHAGAVSKPVVAAVNGFAVGGGFFDVMRCDLRLAAESAIFQLAEVPRSILPRPLIEGIAGSLPDCLVTELGLGQKLTAHRAYEVGLLNRVVPDTELIEAAEATAVSIAALPPLAVRLTLEGLRRFRARSRADKEIVGWESQAVARLVSSEDYREALAAFVEKRPATFVGR